MLTIPSTRKIGDVTVYGDDAVWYRFYLIPSLPSVRRDSEGRPIFLLAIYHLTEQARAENPDLPRGAGYMNFDVQFAVSDEQVKAARTELQTWVVEEYARRRANPAYASLADYASPEPPQVEFAEPLLSSGKVMMQTTQSDVLVSERVAEGPASLVTGATAAFNLDLTSSGASFMKDLLLTREGTGRTDVIPISVVYDLKMWARTPRVSITVKGNSERIHQTLQTVSENNRDNPCTPAEVETYRQKGVNSSSLRESGHVEVIENKGDATVPDEVVEELRNYALELFDTMIEQRFLVPADVDSEKLELEDGTSSIRDTDPGWAAVLYDGPGFSGERIEVTEDVADLGNLRGRISSVSVRSGHRVTLYQGRQFGGSSKQITSSLSSLGGGWSDHASSVRVWRPPVSRYKVRETNNTSTMNLEITIDRSQVVEWPLVCNSTLQTFFAGATPEEMQRHVVEVFADDFDSLGVTVRVLNFEKLALQAVDVETEYVTKDSSGAVQRFPGSFTFHGADSAEKKFDPTILSGKREYRFRYRLVDQDGREGEFTEWETTSNRNLNISVQQPGRLQLDVSAATLNWEILRGVTVRLQYFEPGATTSSAEQTFELSAVAPTRKWEETLGREAGGKVEAEITYFTKDDKVISGPRAKIDITNTLFAVPQPQVDVLNVGLAPAGDWSDVSQTVVSLKYDAGEGRVYDKTYRFTKLDEFAEWTVLLRDPNRRTFSYKILVIYKSGSTEDSGWQDATGDQAIPIHVKGAPKLRVSVLANLVDFKATPAVTVTLNYGSEATTLAFTEPKAVVWEVPMDASGSNEYAYQITWHRPDGEPLTVGPKRTANTQLLIPKAQIAQAGKLDVVVRGFAVNFTATPFVDITLSPKNREGDRKTLTLSQEQKNVTWSVELGDQNQRRYRYTIVYNLADGSRKEGGSGESEDPVISVAAYQA